MGRLTAIVLGAAAGGGFPQWNCRCDVCRLAWSSDNADEGAHPSQPCCVRRRRAVDFAQRVPRSPCAAARDALACSRGRGARDSPIAAVVLTGAEVDQIAGLLTLRERHAFTVFATAETLAAVAANPIFGVLAPDLVARKAVERDRAFLLAGRHHRRAVHRSRQGRCFISKTTIRSLLPKPGPMSAWNWSAMAGGWSTFRERRHVTASHARAPCPRRRRAVRWHAVCRRRDDLNRNRRKNRPPHGTHADRRRERNARGARRSSRPAHLRLISTTPIRSWSRVRPSGAKSRPPAVRSRKTAWRSCCELRSAPRNWKRACAISARGVITGCIRSTSCCMAAACSKGQVQAWALNRYYYQAMIPMKDASLIARCDDAATRREWRSRLVDHDGEPRRRRRHCALAEARPTGLALIATMSFRCAGCCRQRALRSMPMCTSCAIRRCSKRSPPRSRNCSRRPSSASAWTGC